jgi:hypothetical protein
MKKSKEIRIDVASFLQKKSLFTDRHDDAVNISRGDTKEEVANLGVFISSTLHNRHVSISVNEHCRWHCQSHAPLYISSTCVFACIPASFSISLGACSALHSEEWLCLVKRLSCAIGELHAVDSQF